MKVFDFLTVSYFLNNQIILSFLFFLFWQKWASIHVEIFCCVDEASFSLWITWFHFISPKLLNQKFRLRAQMVICDVSEESKWNVYVIMILREMIGP